MKQPLTRMLATIGFSALACTWTGSALAAGPFVSQSTKVLKFSVGSCADASERVLQFLSVGHAVVLLSSSSDFSVQASSGTVTAIATCTESATLMCPGTPAAQLTVTAISTRSQSESVSAVTTVKSAIESNLLPDFSCDLVVHTIPG